MGLMQGVELVKDRADQGAGARPRPARCWKAAKDRGLIVGKGGLYGNVLRISPALNITAADADQAADILDKALAAAASA